MTPIDYRNATWEDLQERMPAMRRLVWHAWKIHGPGTTRELATRAHIDLLQVRPRTTELVQLGFVRLVDEENRGHEGVYQALSEDEARALFDERREAAIHGSYQPELKL